MNLAPAHGLCLLYRRTGRQRYLDLARQIVGEFAAVGPDGKPLAGDYLRRGLAGRAVLRHAEAAVGEPASDPGPGRAGTGSPATPTYRTAFENLWWSIVELDRHNNGGFSSGEQAQGNPYHRGAIETCCTIAWMAMSVEMLATDRRPDRRRRAGALDAQLGAGAVLADRAGGARTTRRWTAYRKANFHEIVFQCPTRLARAELLQRQRRARARPDRRLGRDARRRRGAFLNWYGPGTIAATLASGGRSSSSRRRTTRSTGRVRIRVEPERPGRVRPPPAHPALVGRHSGQGQWRAGVGSEAGELPGAARTWKPGDQMRWSST